MSRFGDALLRAKESAQSTPGDAEIGATQPKWLRREHAESADAAPWQFEPADTPQPAAPLTAPAARVPSSAPAPPPPSEELTRPAIAEPATTAAPRSPGTQAVFRQLSPEVAERTVVSPELSAPCIEQFRRLAAMLHQAQSVKGTRVVMIASALASEGKSLTATNLALTLSESYRRRVLLIDADLRRPSLHEIFGVTNATGLSEGLRMPGPVAFATIPISDSLTLLPAGEPDPDPMAGLTSDRMKMAIEEARSTFDWVIVDTPPVGVMPDANLLAAMADAVLLVVNAGTSPYDIVKQAAATLGVKKIVGVVLNRASAVQSMPGQYGYDPAVPRRS